MARPAMYTPEEARAAKRASDARRLKETLARIVIQPHKDEGTQIREAAAAAGMSLQGYILQAVRAQMGTAEDDRVHLSISAASLEPYRLEGERAGQTAARLLRLGIQAAKQD